MTPLGAFCYAGLRFRSWWHWSSRPVSTSFNFAFSDGRQLYWWGCPRISIIVLRPVLRAPFSTWNSPRLSPGRRSQCWIGCPRVFLAYHPPGHQVWTALVQALSCGAILPYRAFRFQVAKVGSFWSQSLRNTTSPILLWTTRYSIRRPARLIIRRKACSGDCLKAPYRVNCEM